MNTTTNLTSYLLKSVSCRIEKDYYNEGCSNETFHSFEIGINEIFASKEELIERMNQGLFGAEYKEDDFDFEQLLNGHNIQTDVLVTYKPNINWQEFYYRTDDELKKWKKGKMDMYNAQFYFSVLPIEVLGTNKPFKY